MKPIAAITLSLVVGLFSLFPHYATAGEQSQNGTTSAPSAPPSELHFVSILKLQGVVSNLDSKKRLITLRSSDGKGSTLEVRRRGDLKGVKIGDRVTVRYFEGARIRKPKSGRATTISSLKDGLTVNESGTPSKTQRRLATVRTIDLADQELTVEGGDGSVETLMISDPGQLINIKAGDQVEIERTQALALSIQKEED